MNDQNKAKRQGRKPVPNLVDTQRLKSLIDTIKSRQIIADEIGCDVSTITKHYNGNNPVDLAMLYNYAKYFGVSTDYLLGLSDVATVDDVEEVVYCKNCKFRNTHTCFAKHETSDNDYCSCGVRMALSDCEKVIRCKDCKYLMFSDFYGECSKGYFGIVTPDDFCSRGERKDGEEE